MASIASLLAGQSQFPSVMVTVFLLGVTGMPGWVSAQGGGQEDSQPQEGGPEFSALLTWRSLGKTSEAQLFVKKDRYRIEHRGGVRTDLGYAGVTIVRLDQQKVWYILSRRRLVLEVPLTVDYLLPLSVRLEGEIDRTLIGDSMASGHSAQLFEVVVERGSQRETFYEWVDVERDVLLKLVSQNRDWSVEYEHIVFSKQPNYFFETPLGYKKIEAQDKQPSSG